MHKKYFIFAGNVKAQPRPRFKKHQYKPYDLKQAAEYKKAVAAAYKEQCGGFMFPDGVSLYMHITIERHLPKSKQRKTRVVFLPDIGKPDIDNYAKAVMDALNGVAYKDDSQITRLLVEKKPRCKKPFDDDCLHVTISDIEE